MLARTLTAGGDFLLSRRLRPAAVDSLAATLQSDVSHGWTNDSNHPFITKGIKLPCLVAPKVSR